MTSEKIAVRPWPRHDGPGADFWAGAAESRLLVPRCVACGRPRPPSEVVEACSCGARQVDWAESRGEGAVYSFSVDRRQLMSGFESNYVVVLVVLDDVGRDAPLVSNLTRIEPEDVEIGMRVKVEYTTSWGPTVMPVFVPQGSA